jgi:hypothetical protein
VPVWIVLTILLSERNGVVKEEANHVLLQGALCGFNACFVDPRGSVDRECREYIHSGKEQCPVSARKQKVLKRGNAYDATLCFGLEPTPRSISHRLTVVPMTSA